MLQLVTPCLHELSKAVQLQVSVRLSQYEVPKFWPDFVFMYSTLQTGRVISLLRTEVWKMIYIAS